MKDDSWIVEVYGSPTSVSSSCDNFLFLGIVIVNERKATKKKRKPLEEERNFATLGPLI